MKQAEDNEEAQNTDRIRYMMTITAEDEFVWIDFGKTAEEMVKNPAPIACSSPEFALLALFTVL